VGVGSTTPRVATAAGPVLSAAGIVVAVGVLEIGDQFGTSSADFSAKKYGTSGISPSTVTVWEVPAAAGRGTPVTAVARAKFSSVIADVEYRMSYWLAVPAAPSSPGAVQVSCTVVAVTVPVARSVVAAGGRASADGAVVVDATFDRSDQFGTSSAVFTAK
jgi:hypothetical protein